MLTYLACMDVSHIKINDMLTQMKHTLASGKPKPFTIGFLTADRHRKKGGEFREIKAVLSSKGKRSGSIANRTINVQHYGTDVIQSIHYDNILYFNSRPLS